MAAAIGWPRRVAAAQTLASVRVSLPAKQLQGTPDLVPIRPQDFRRALLGRRQQACLVEREPIRCFVPIPEIGPTKVHVKGGHRTVGPDSVGTIWLADDENGC